MTAFLILASLGAIGLGLLLRGLLAGYPPARPGVTLGAKQQAVIAACAETMFPSREFMPLTGAEAGVVSYLDRHVASLPGDKAFQIRLLFVFVEHSPWIFGLGGRWPAPRFTRLTDARRLAFLQEMATSRIYFRRLCFLSLRALLCMAYVAHPAIAARVGSAPNLRPFALPVLPAGDAP